MIRSVIISLLVFTALLMSGCQEGPAAELRNEIISSDVHGNADDGDSANPKDDYRHPQKLNAEDLETKASSAPPQYDTVSGNADAVPDDPASPTLENDVAIGRSNNKVISKFVVNRAGTFTFNFNLDVEEIKLVHDGQVFVSVRAAMNDANGNTLPPDINSGLASINFQFQEDGQNPPKVVINPGPNNQTDQNGNYNKRISGPNGGIELTPGVYQLEMDLRIRAEAPVQLGPDKKKHEAHVKNAKLEVELR